MQKGGVSVTRLEVWMLTRIFWRWGLPDPLFMLLQEEELASPLADHMAEECRKRPPPSDLYAHPESPPVFLAGWLQEKPAAQALLIEEPIDGGVPEKSLED